jgi:hypothetical protein
VTAVEQLAHECAQAAARGPAGARVVCHLLSALVCLGRHTVTGHLATAGRQFTDWSADFRLYSRERLDSRALFGPLLRELSGQLAPAAPVVVALDDTVLKKTSRRTPGVSYLADRQGPKFHLNLQLGQRCLQQSLAISDRWGAARLVPVDFVLAPPAAKPRRGAPAAEWAAYRGAQREQALGRVAQQRVGALRQRLDDLPATQDRLLLSVVDGGYTNGTFLKGLPARTSVIGRLRGDAKLYHLPPAPGGPGRGRPRVYGAVAPTPEQLRLDKQVPWQKLTVHFGGRRRRVRYKTLAPVRWRATGAAHDLRLVVLAPSPYRHKKQGRWLYRKPAYLLCTDPTLPVAQLVQYYLWRWQIELNFRDEKTLLGVGQAQVHHPAAVERVPALSVAAYAILQTAALRLYGQRGPQLQLPLPKWRHRKPARASLQQLITQLRHELWGEYLNYSDFANADPANPKSLKIHPSLESALFYSAA